MKNEYKRPTDFKVDPRKHENAKCTCIDKGEIHQDCLDGGICPTLKIISVHKGYKLTKDGQIRKGLKPFGKGFEAIKKVFEKMKRKK
ncbi:MAG: hypothetical protein ABIS12_10880 [Bacteroidia bacterium]